MARQKVQGNLTGEKALDLLHVNVDCDHVINSHRRQHVRHDSRRNRLTHLRLTILTPVAIIRNYSRYMVN